MPRKRSSSSTSRSTKPPAAPTTENNSPAAELSALGDYSDKVETYFNSLDSTQEQNSPLPEQHIHAFLLQYFTNTPHHDLELFLRDHVEDGSVGRFLGDLMHTLARCRVRRHQRDSSTELHEEQEEDQQEEDASPRISLASYSALLQILHRFMRYLHIPSIRRLFLQHFSLPLYFSIADFDAENDDEDATERKAPDTQFIGHLFASNNALSEKFLQLYALDQEDRNFSHQHIYLLPNILENYFLSLEALSIASAYDNDNNNNEDSFSLNYLYCCRVLQFVTLLLQQWTFRNYILDYCFYRRIYEMTKIFLSKISKHLIARFTFTMREVTLKLDRLIRLLKFYSFYLHFDTSSSSATSDEQPTTSTTLVDTRQYESLKRIQHIAWKNFEQIHDLAIANPAQLQSREYLVEQLQKLSLEDLNSFAIKCGLVPQAGAVQNKMLMHDQTLLIEIFVSHCEKRSNDVSQFGLNTYAPGEDIPLFPTEEQIIEDTNMLCGVTNPIDLTDSPEKREPLSQQLPLALPQLTLQYLNLNDYLIRNFVLYRLELAHQLRKEINLSLAGMKPFVPAKLMKKQSRITPRRIHFSGSHQFSLPLSSSEIVALEPPQLGQKHHSRVLASVTINAKGLRPETRAQWENLKYNDVLYLCTVSMREQATMSASSNSNNDNSPPPQQFEIRFIRGCKFQYIMDDQGKQFDPSDVTASISDTDRSYYFVVELDSVQFGLDMKFKSSDRVYEDFNLLVRREQSLNGNDSIRILESIRSLMQQNSSTEAHLLPEFMDELFLGHSSESDPVELPAPKKLFLNEQIFRNVKEIKAALAEDYSLNFSSGTKTKAPYQISFEYPSQDEEEEEEESVPSLHISHYDAPQNSTSDDSKSKQQKNSKRKQPQSQSSPQLSTSQQQAIFSSVQRGFTLIQGAQATGKTESAAHILLSALENFSNERFLVVCRNVDTLSNLIHRVTQLSESKSAPDDKILLVHREAKSIHKKRDYSVNGREQCIIQRRKKLLKQVHFLAQSLNIPHAEDVSYTCESAGYFYTSTIQPAWERFVEDYEAESQQDSSSFSVRESFPFVSYLKNALNWSSNSEEEETSLEQDFATAQKCFSGDIQTLFEQLNDIRSLEVIRSKEVRRKHILSVYSRLIFTTTMELCVRREELISQNFSFDSVLFLETEQNLEIETLLSMLSQKSPDRLKRVIMFGDECKIVPHVTNPILQQQFTFDQSTFSRFVKLQVPHFSFNEQFSKNPALVNLTRWMYGDDLSDHSALRKRKWTMPPALTYEYQFVDVQDYRDQGEVALLSTNNTSAASGGEYQNLAEAEWIVHLFMYQRLKGYPADKIVLFTPFEAQRRLILDVLDRRCKMNPLLGMPRSVYSRATQSNVQFSCDYLLVSLVRTEYDESVHNASLWNQVFSSAQKGIFVFGRFEAFAKCKSLSKLVEQFEQRPLQLSLEPTEAFSSQKKRRKSSAELMEGLEQFGELVSNMLAEQCEAIRKLQDEYLNGIEKLLEEHKAAVKESSAKQKSSEDKGQKKAARKNQNGKKRKHTGGKKSGSNKRKKRKVATSDATK